MFSHATQCSHSMDINSSLKSSSVTMKFDPALTAIATLLVAFVACTDATGQSLHRQLEDDCCTCVPIQAYADKVTTMHPIDTMPPAHTMPPVHIMPPVYAKKVKSKRDIKGNSRSSSGSTSRSTTRLGVVLSHTTEQPSIDATKDDDWKGFELVCTCKEQCRP